MQEEDFRFVRSSLHQHKWVRTSHQSHNNQEASLEGREACMFTPTALQTSKACLHNLVISPLLKPNTPFFQVLRTCLLHKPPLWSPLTWCSGYLAAQYSAQPTVEDVVSSAATMYTPTWGRSCSTVSCLPVTQEGRGVVRGLHPGLTHL